MTRSPATPATSDTGPTLETIELVQECLSRVGMLSQRQRDVLRLVSAGATNNQISSRLGIAGATVENHVKDLKYRLRVDSRSLLAIVGYFEAASALLLERSQAAPSTLDHGEIVLALKQARHPRLDAKCAVLGFEPEAIVDHINRFS